MCIGDDPVARTLPYLISGIIFVMLTLLLYIPQLIKDWNPRYVKFSKIVLLLISVILLSSAVVQYTLRYHRLCI
ncbi:Uncharacterised protein [uncultured archaeon]|nr:Uncharacterised protein [uncultured archaeon]